jgi:hypothetical protein
VAPPEGKEILNNMEYRLRRIHPNISTEIDELVEQYMFSKIKIFSKKCIKTNI